MYRGKWKEVPLIREKKRKLLFSDDFWRNYCTMFSTENETRGKGGYLKRVVEWRMGK